MTALLTVARELVAEGRSVVPIENGEKRPALPTWAEYQTRRPTDAELVDWFSDNGHDALGVVTGAVSRGLVILDFDGSGKDYEAFCKTWPDLAKSRTVITGKGQRHVWFEVDTLPKSRKYVTVWGLVEIRAEGNQTLAPPSRHPSGQLYRWVDPAAEVRRVPNLAGLVAWLKENAPEPQSLSRPREDAGRIVGGGTGDLLPCATAALGGIVGEGTRNDTTYALAQHFAAAGRRLSEAEQEVGAVALGWGLPEREALATIRSAYNATAHGLECETTMAPWCARGACPVYRKSHGLTSELHGLDAKPFDVGFLSKRGRVLLADGWDPSRAHGKRYQSKAAAGLSVAGEMLRTGATQGQTAKALLDSPLTDGDKKLVTWLVEKAQETPKLDSDIEEFHRHLLRILTDADRTEGDRATPMLIRWQRAGRLLLRFLDDRGYSVFDPLTLNAYYMDENEHRLLRVDRDAPGWVAWLHHLTSVNPADTSFNALHAEALTRARLEGERVAVVKVASWDGQVLRVSRFDGAVYRLDGESITTKPNGAGGILFEDDPAWQSYEPDFEPTSSGKDIRGKVLDWILEEVPNWDGDAEAHALTLRAWFFSTFFPEIMPTKPVLVMLGEKGSGKSMTLRLLLKLLFGPGGEVAGTPDRPDGFTAAAAACHILALDNLDQFTGWLRDKIARLTTGAVDYYRRLYTSNEMGRVTYRC